MFEGVHGSTDLGTVSSSSSSPQGGGGSQVLRIGDAVTLAYQAAGSGPDAAAAPHLVLEWCGGPESDVLADAVVAVVLQASGSPPALSAIEEQRAAALKRGDAAAAEAAELGITTELLGAQFGPARVDPEQVPICTLLLPGALARSLAAHVHPAPPVDHAWRTAPPHPPLQGLIFVDVDGKHVIINAKSSKVQCADDQLRARVERALGRMAAALQPCEVGGSG